MFLSFYSKNLAAVTLSTTYGNQTVWVAVYPWDLSTKTAVVHPHTDAVRLAGVEPDLTPRPVGG